MPEIKTVLFDLDGTLVDTAPDMVAALDRLCQENDRPALPYARVRPHVSDGSLALIRLAFGEAQPAQRLEALKTRYLQIYENHLAERSRLFDGMDAVLAALEASGRHWGVVTNKPGWLTEPLMRALGLAGRAACMVSCDSTPYRKPHPEPMYLACRQAGAAPEDCLYVGDARRDIEAGRNAGMQTVAACYGYIREDDDPANWQADYLIEQPAQLLSLETLA